MKMPSGAPRASNSPQNWPSVCALAYGLGMLSACAFLLPSGLGFFHEVNWDALVAVGTLLLALVTTGAVWIPIRIERQRLEEREKRWRQEAGYIALAFDRELYIAEGVAKIIIRTTRRSWRTTPVDTAVKSLDGFSRMRTPLIEKFAFHLDRFDPETATKVLKALSRISMTQILRNPQQTRTPAQALRSCRSSVRTAITIIREVRDARKKLPDYFTPTTERQATEE
jgi:hypothetical protein